MERHRCASRLRWMSGLAITIGLACGWSSRGVSADVFSPQSDDWKGTTPSSKWHLTIMGDAQTEPNAIEVNDG